MAERLWTARLIGSLIAIAIVVGIGWAFVYYFAIVPLASEGPQLLRSVTTNFNLASTLWWKDFLSLAFDLLIILVAIIGTWWVLGHFAIEAREVGKWRKYYKSSEAKSDVWVQRLGLWQRVQHIWMIITFVICAFTGIVMHLANNPYWRELYTSRETFVTVHILSGVAMGVLVILHFTQYSVEAILAKIRGESITKKYPMLEIYSFRFLRELGKTLLYTLTPKVKKEPYGKYNPEQLFEYWGVYWGIAILGVPGIVMAIYGPGVLNGVMWVMHFKEAILAIVFLLMVHIAYTHFRPSVFPLDPTFIYGRMPMRRIREEHELWAKELEASPQTFAGSDAPSVSVSPGEGGDK